MPDSAEPSPAAGAAELTRRHRLSEAEALSRRLDRPMGALGIVFLFVVLGQTVAAPPLTSVLSVVGWVLWAAFVAELALRAYVAKDQRAFWRRNWWQVLFLAVPFLRVLRVVRALPFARAARLGGVLTSAVRGSRSAGRLLSGRLGWLAVVTVVVVLASSQLLYILEAYGSYAEALHAAALATIVGEPLSSEAPAARVVEVVLAAFSVAVFATLAGAVGAYFLGRPQGGPAPVTQEPRAASRDIDGAEAARTWQGHVV